MTTAHVTTLKRESQAFKFQRLFWRSVSVRRILIYRANVSIAFSCQNNVNYHQIYEILDGVYSQGSTEEDLQGKSQKKERQSSYHMRQNKGVVFSGPNCQ